MKTYTSFNHTKIVNSILDECIKQASLNPLTIYYLIVDSKKYYEEILLKKNPTLFNIEIITLSDLCNKILDRHHIHPQKKTKKDMIIDIVRYNKNHEESLFHHANNHYLTALNILEVLQNIYLYNAQETSEHLAMLSQKKIATLFELSRHIDVSQMYYYEDVLQCIDHHDAGHYYFLIDIYQPKIKEIIESLDCISNVYCINPQVTTIEDYSDYVCAHLFDTYSSKKNMPHPYSILKASSIEEEVKQVVYDLFIKLDGHTFKDFAIYYPSEIYYQYLSKYFDKMNITYNKHSQITNYAYKALRCLIEYINDGEEGHLVEAVSSHYLKAFQDQFQISLVKSSYTSHHYVNHASYTTIKGLVEQLSTYRYLDELVDKLKNIIKEHFITHDDCISLLSLLDSISSHDEISINELIQLLDSLISSSTATIKEQIDSVYLFNYNQPYSELLGVKHIYMLGMNETVIPAAYKNTGLILNNEASLLHYPTTHELLRQHYQKIENVFSNKHESILLSYSIMDASGGEMIVSSIIKKMKNLLNIPDAKKRILLHPAFKEELYLMNHEDEDEHILNQDIKTFKTSHNQIPHLIDMIEHRPLSISKLEMYNQCPYKYFNQYVLHINKIRNNTIYSNEVGTLVHYVLEHCAHYFKNYIASDKTHLEKDIENNVQQYLLEHESNKFNLPQNKFILSMVKNDLYNTILVLCKHMEQGFFTLSSCEQRITNNMGSIDLKGFIDRVDLYNDVVKIIDYKSSQKELNINLAKQGFKIQMLVYLDMLCRSQHLRPGAILYFNTKKRLLKTDKSLSKEIDIKDFYSLYQMDGICLSDAIELIDNEIDGKSDIIKVKLKKDGSPDAHSKVISQEELQETIACITQLIEKLYANMQQGIYDIYPTRSLNSKIDMTINPCTYCEYRSLCQYDIFYNEDRMIGKEDDQ